MTINNQQSTMTTSSLCALGGAGLRRRDRTRQWPKALMWPRRCEVFVVAGDASAFELQPVEEHPWHVEFEVLCR